MNELCIKKEIVIIIKKYINECPCTLRKLYPKVVSKGNVFGSWVKLYTAVVA